MHIVELLRLALALAESMGYGIRQEWLGGAAGGACEIAGKKWIFVDLSLDAGEQLDQVVSALREDPAIHTASVSEPLRAYLGLRWSA